MIIETCKMDSLGRIRLKDGVIRALDFKINDVVFVSVKENQIKVSKDNENFIYQSTIDESLSVSIGRHIALSKQLINIDEKESTVEMLIEKDQLIIPLTPEQSMQRIRVIRAVDELKRVVLPKCMTDKLKWEKGTLIDIITENDRIIILKKDNANVKIDELGRVTIPIDALNELGIKILTYVEVILAKDKIELIKA